MPLLTGTSGRPVLCSDTESDIDAYGRSRKIQREKAAQWRRENPELARAQYQKYRDKNKQLCAARTRAWQEKNPDKYKLAKRRVHLRQFGITIEQYDDLLQKQGGKCAICRQQEKHGRYGRLFRLSVDHCHSTNRVRGLLCNDCNRAIGLLSDSHERCIQAAEYLK